MKIRRRTFLKTGGSLLTALLAGTQPAYCAGRSANRVMLGREVAGRCPLCSLGCGVIYRSAGYENWVVEGDPDCPVGKGSLCAKGASLASMVRVPGTDGPLHRAPGARRWVRVSWAEALDLLARRLKDMRDREMLSRESGEKSVPNRFDSLGVVTGGCLTNEEAYTTAKLFRSLGVGQLDTTVRSSHGMGVLGLLETLGFPGATHPVTQVAFSDVAVILGCNPGQTVPAVFRFLEDVRRRRGVVIVIDPRRSETVRRDDLFLRIRPGTDGAVLGAFIHYILEYGDLDKAGLIKHSDAALLVLREVMGEYERHKSGKLKDHLAVDETLADPYSVFQRMKKHFRRYDLRKVARISGADFDLLQRACTLIARTTSPHFSASFLLGSGAMGHHSATQVVRMAVMAQALLGNLHKKGGGIILPAAAGNAQGVCDMGLLAPFLPGYLDFSNDTENGWDADEKAALKALCRAWFPQVDFAEAIDFLPRRGADEKPTLSAIFQGVEKGNVKGLVVVGADPAGSFPGSELVGRVLAKLDLMVVMNPSPNRTSEFWKQGPLREEALKTEVLFVPTEMPASKKGTMTDSGRRVRMIHPRPEKSAADPGLLDFLVGLGNVIRSKYTAEGGAFSAPILNMSWPLTRVLEDVMAEINGWRENGPAGEVPLSRDEAWKPRDRCGNRLYRGWVTEKSILADRRDAGDPHGTGLFEGWGWSWPGGIPDPFSFINVGKGDDGVTLRWEAQGGEKYKAADILPIRKMLPVRFWTMAEVGSPFPEHYEPFSSPLHDMLTGGLSNPYLGTRDEKKRDWRFLSRARGATPKNFPLIVSVHRTGNTAGTGGVILTPYLRELGSCRIVEVNPLLAAKMGIRTKDLVRVSSPFWEEGIPAVVMVTGRVGAFAENGSAIHVVSMTLFGDDAPGVNFLTAPVFDSDTGGLETRTFMGKIKKV